MSRGSRNRGKRYEEPKLNIKKVFAVVIAIIVIIMFIFIIKGILDGDQEKVKIASKDYFVSFKDNKWGVIDSSGNDVIVPSYEEMIVIPNSKNDVFLCTYDVNYETGEYKTKALNSKNEDILTGYDQVEAIQNKDENNNLWYEYNVLKVQKDGKYGLIDFSGKVLRDCEFDEIVAVEGIQNAIKVSKDNLKGIVGNDGKEILKTEYVEVQALGKDNKAGYIVTGTDNKVGIVDLSGQAVLAPVYDEMMKVYGNDLYVVRNGTRQLLVQKDGTEVLSRGFDTITGILKNVENGVIYTTRGKYGVMKTTGEVVIQPTYDNIQEAKTGNLIVTQNGKVGVIDLTQNQKVEAKYTSIVYNAKADIYIAEDEQFNNDILDGEFAVKQSGILIEFNEEKEYIALKQGDDYKYYNLRFEEKPVTEILQNNTLYMSKKDGKYGFVDKQGKEVVAHIYDDAMEQNTAGFAAVKKDGKWGSIDAKGKVVQEPTYQLDDYLKIDFVGRWHLGKDMNLNYYNQI